MLARRTRYLLCAVAPIIEAAEQAHQHEAGAARDAIDIGVDREGVAQR
jgi:hypothetical protein